ncbi:hypothetical protein LA080_010404 [Diaporthe eres]|nr:hypothetical protein LA080_010404 [Diaporthe eres]
MDPDPSREDLYWLADWGGECDPNVEPCRRAAVLQGQKDAATLSSDACDGGSGWAGSNLDLGNVAGHGSTLLPIQRAGHGRVEMKWPSGSNICAALQCTPLCSGDFEAAEMAFAECSLHSLQMMQPSTARKQGICAEMRIE